MGRRIVGRARAARPTRAALTDPFFLALVFARERQDELVLAGPSVLMRPQISPHRLGQPLRYIQTQPGMGGAKPQGLVQHSGGSDSVSLSAGRPYREYKLVGSPLDIEENLPSRRA